MKAEPSPSSSPVFAPRLRPDLIADLIVIPAILAVPCGIPALALENLRPGPDNAPTQRNLFTRRFWTMTATTPAIDEKKAGHAAHTQAAEKRGLPGTVKRPINVTMLGAGSNFCSTICRDILCMPGIVGGELRLIDIDKDRLETMAGVIEKLVVETGHEHNFRVRASTNRRDLLPGTDYVINSIEVSGMDCVVYDNDIPLKYGVDQCIGDTIGPGGLMKGLRTGAVFVDIVRDIAELCPKAPVLNYTNPMSMLVCAAARAVPQVSVVGLCHSVQGTSHLLAGYADVPYEELDWACWGINHLAWFTKLEHKGKNLYDTVLMEKFRKEVATAIEEAEAGKGLWDNRAASHGAKVEKPYTVEDIVRKDMCVNFGAFITESSGHLSEYLPYYRTHPEGQKLLRLGYHGGSRFYASNWPDWRKHADETRNKMLSGEEPLPKLERSWEYGSWIIEAIEKDTPHRIHGNVMNVSPRTGAGPLIPNLMHDACVEVPVLIDGTGITPSAPGRLPSQMAAVCESNLRFFDLAAKAIVEKNLEAATHALMLDPLTAAVLSPREIRAMAEELFKAEKEFLPGYK